MEMPQSSDLHFLLTLTKITRFLSKFFKNWELRRTEESSFWIVIFDIYNKIIFCADCSSSVLRTKETKKILKSRAKTCRHISSPPIIGEIWLIVFVCTGQSSDWSWEKYILVYWTKEKGKIDKVWTPFKIVMLLGLCPFRSLCYS